MVEEASAANTTEMRPRGLLSRVIGVIVSPRETFTDVAARPRALGALAVALFAMITCQTLFLSTEVGRKAMLDQQVQSMESFGVTVSDEMYQQMQSRMANAPYTAAVWQLIFVPLAAAVIAGLLLGVFNALLDGTATFKHVYAVVAHSAIVFGLSQIFSTPISYARGEFASATRLSVFFPMLEEDTFLARVLGGIDLFLIWWIVVLAIGIAVLYKKRTGPIASTLLAIYGAIVLLVAAVRSF